METRSLTIDNKYKRLNQIKNPFLTVVWTNNSQQRTQNDIVIVCMPRDSSNSQLTWDHQQSFQLKHV